MPKNNITLLPREILIEIFQQLRRTIEATTISEYGWYETPSLVRYMLVARLFHSVLEPIQYAQVTVKDKNQFSLSRTLSVRPEIGALVKDLGLDVRPDKRAFALAACIGLESQSVSYWWPDLKLPSNCRTIFTRLQNATIVMPDIASAPLVEASIMVPSLKTFSVIPTHMDESWPPKMLGSKSMNITNLWIGSSFPSYQMNRSVTIGHSGIAHLPEILQSITKLEEFALVYPERSVLMTSTRPAICCNDIVKALLSHAASLKTITIANDEEGQILLGDELCDFRPFTKLTRLDFIADTDSILFWERLPPNLQELQVEYWVGDFEQESFANSIKHFAESKATLLPSLRLLVLWIRVGVDHDPLENYEINLLECLVRLLKSVGTIFKVVADTCFESIAADSTKSTTLRALLIG